MSGDGPIDASWVAQTALRLKALEDSSANASVRMDALDGRIANAMRHADNERAHVNRYDTRIASLSARIDDISAAQRADRVQLATAIAELSDDKTSGIELRDSNLRLMHMLERSERLVRVLSGLVVLLLIAVVFTLARR